MLRALIPVLVGLVLGIVVNILADVLPQFRLRDENEELETPPTSEDEAKVSESQKPIEWFSVARLLSARYLTVIILFIAVALYLWQTESTIVFTVIKVLYVALFTLIAVIDIEHRLSLIHI